MSEPPNLEALARRYLDLWQDQATALAGDAELTRQVGRWLSMMQAGMAHGFQSSNAFTSTEAARSSGQPSRPAPGSAPAAAPSGRGDLGLEQLSRRLAAVEKRLARLEGGVKTRSPKPRRRTRQGKA